MSDGDGKDKFLSEKENQLPKRKKKSGSDEFAQAIARIAVAQVCESFGFQSFHQSALDSLADVAVRYIREIGKTASSYANLANRSECNVFDVIQGLEDLGSGQGFSGASDVRHSLSDSGVVKDIISYVAQAEEIPFAYLLPVFPVVKERVLDPSFAQAEENPPDEHIPSWLPKFPDPSTYATYSDLSSGSTKDSEIEIISKTQHVEEQHSKGERSLLNLQQRLMCNGSEAGVVVEQGDAARVQRAIESNPFLSAPLQFGEKEVNLPVVPDRILDESLGFHQSRGVIENHILKPEPSNEAGRSGVCEPEDSRKILTNGRPSVQFKFGNAKKSSSILKNPQNEGIGKFLLRFDDDYHGEEAKKRRAEKINWEDTELLTEASDL